MANTKLQKAFSAEGDNIYKWTYSFWVKRGTLGGDQAMASAYYSASYQGRILFRSDDQLEVFDYWNGSYTLQKKLNRKFRDTSAWYHIVVSNDNTQASADDRTKIYVNGVQETSFATNTQYPQNQRTTFGNDYTHYIGSYGSGDYLDGSMSHIHFIDGTAYAPTEFGETDSTTGEWKIKTNVSVTYGSNGYFILKDGNSVTDQSGEGNNFTVGGGTLTDTLDCPANVFATLNSLYKTVACTLSNGSTKSQITSATSKYAPGSTIKVSSGKWYAEFKCNSNGGAEQQAVGLYGDEQNASSNDQGVGKANDSYSWRSDGEWMVDNTGSPDFNSYGSGDIISIALDLDNNYLYFAKNGVWENSGDPTSGATGTGGKSITAASGVVDGVYSMGAGSNSSGNLSDWSANFGNGYFGTTAVASAGTNASGIGIFEYDVPTGYTALSTKGLNL